MFPSFKSEPTDLENRKLEGYVGLLFTWKNNSMLTNERQKTGLLNLDLFSSTFFLRNICSLLR